MDSSRRAVESYWRSRMIDGATSDEDKVAPVYKLEEICELLRSSHVSIGKEVSDFILKRLEHKSPVVKQKALRLIKYSVGKSGTDFRREMQRHSAVVRQLFHYKGQLDPLKGDAPNKAVRDMAHEAISAIFSEENKPAPVEDLSLNKRIQGFGNTNFEMPSEDKKSFLSEVVGLGSASIKQGLSSFAQGNSMRKNENGSYRSPNLRRSLTIENDYSDRYEPVELRNETQGGYGISKNVAGGSWNQDSRVVKEDRLNGDSSASYTGSKTREEKLLETIVTSGGVRLQPTRDAIQVFLVEAAKLDALAMSRALEAKLQSPLWQVLMKAICVLESILRKKDDEKFSIISSYFCENNDVVVKCSESPQSSLREKANKVLSLLGGEQAGGLVSGSERSVKAETTTVVQMPDLIDTADPEDHSETNNYATNPSDQNISNLSTSSTPLIDDLFTDSLGTGANNSEQKNADDPFADVLFHTSEGKEHVEDLFSGMTVDSKPVASGNLLAADKSGSEPFDDIFGSHTEILPKQENQKNNFNDLMAGFSINEDQLKPEGSSAGVPSESIFSDSSSNPSQQLSSDALSSLLGSQSAGMNANPFPFGTMPYNIPAGMTLNPSIASQPMNYSAMGNLFAQQQFLAAMSNLQHIGNLNVHNSGAANLVGGNGGSPLPDIFQPNFPTQASMPALNNSKKEDTRAFDFISDHLASARDSKRVA
ncbi:protein MODIFIED TRANSPORT TO THE VACUOLE 1 [Citrus sinensis]|uniref:Protein MODIFIED TRANSPORT TO THE VACUOLE 1 n=1 Tax=Citrus sinensis TaxID=2711 RepID=A0ACB8J964_CITSI|nr:protein MODIFIED TRANSPORT TO THE VACUOLE 1 [Citrus sinensis]